MFTKRVSSFSKASTKAEPCGIKYCTGSIVIKPDGKRPKNSQLKSIKEVKNEAINFMEEYYKEIKSMEREESLKEKRMGEVLNSIDRTGTYSLTKEELEFGAKLAWRNAPRCIGRQQWKNLKLFDFRHVKSEEEIFKGCLEHLKYATNGGALRSTISIFPKPTEPNKETRIWNSQLIRYAGYLQTDGSVIGDPESFEFTEVCKSLGWTGKGGPFDVLPLVIQYNGGLPKSFEIPESYIQKVKIAHPSYPKLSELGLEWYAVPAISNISLDCGGIEFTCAPFNGWYMVTEISVRNFLDEHRYNLIKPIAKCFGFDTNDQLSLWKDRTSVEFTSAVLHSFKGASVTITDHHSVSEQFCRHLKSEVNLRGGCPADWVWIVPPISGSLLPVFHQEMLNYTLKPSFNYQDKAWKHFIFKKKKFTSLKQISKFVLVCIKLTLTILRKRHRLTVLYGSEGGRSKIFARHLERRFKGTFWTKFLSLDQYEFDTTSNEQHFIAIVTSTFGNGEAPSNAEMFYTRLIKMVAESNSHLTNKDHGSKTSLRNYMYAVFALGSSAYPDFCAFGRDVDTKLCSLGAKEIFPIGEGDELGGQEKSFFEWSEQSYLASCMEFNIHRNSLGDQINQANPKDYASFKTMHPRQRMSEDTWSNWSDSNFRIIMYDGQKRIKDMCAQLSETHNLTIYGATVLDVKNLQTTKSSRKTNFIRLSIDGLDKKLNYQVGDSLAVYPSNCKTVVNRFLKRCENSFDPDEPIMLEVNVSDNEKNKQDDWVKYDRFGTPISLNNLFTKHLDLMSPPSQTFLSLLATKATHQDDINTLQTLVDNDQEYNKWKVYNSPTIIDVLEEFPSVKISLPLLATQIPLLKPRYYSISSSPKINPNEIHLTAALLEYKTQDGNGSSRRGVCTAWMDQLNIGDVVPCYIKKSTKLRLPTTQEPIILVGPGTGIAPFRAFWQELQYISKHQQNGTKQVLPEVHLYTGCRSPELDILFHNELETMQREGILSNVFCAFSRIPGKPKVYVQDLMKKNAHRIYDILCKKNGNMFVCGGIEMAKDVKKTVVEIIQECSKTNYEQSIQTIEQLKIDGKYHEEVFGITFHGQSSKNGIKNDIAPPDTINNNYHEKM